MVESDTVLGLGELLEGKGRCKARCEQRANVGCYCDEIQKFHNGLKKSLGGQPWN